MITADVGADTFVQPAYRVRECAHCGLLYRDEILSSDDLARYYSALAATHWDFAGYFPTEKAVLAQLKKLPPRARILDFGCSSGRLLAGLTSSYQCFGIEINDAAAAAAAQQGLEIIDLDQLPQFAPFDAIVLVDVFEHLTQPAHLLRTLVSSLARNGQLIIVTGDGDSRICRRDPAQFWYFRNLEHVTMLTRRGAEWIARTLRLRLVEWNHLSHYDLTFRERIVQHAQTWLYWQFRERTFFARTLLRWLPVPRLRRADIAPVCTATRDHVVAVFVRGGHRTLD